MYVLEHGRNVHVRQSGRERLDEVEASDLLKGEPLVTD